MTIITPIQSRAKEARSTAKKGLEVVATLGVALLLQTTIGLDMTPDTVQVQTNDQKDIYQSLLSNKAFIGKQQLNIPEVLMDELDAIVSKCSAQAPNVSKAWDSAEQSKASDSEAWVRSQVIRIRQSQCFARTFHWFDSCIMYLYLSCYRFWTLNFELSPWSEYQKTKPNERTIMESLTLNHGSVQWSLITDHKLRSCIVASTISISQFRITAFYFWFPSWCRTCRALILWWAGLFSTQCVQPRCNQSLKEPLTLSDMIWYHLTPDTSIIFFKFLWFMIHDPDSVHECEYDEYDDMIRFDMICGMLRCYVKSCNVKRPYSRHGHGPGVWQLPAHIGGSFGLLCAVQVPTTNFKLFRFADFDFSII